MRRRRLVIAAVLLLIAGAVGFAMFGEREPRYNGRPLSEWINTYHDSAYSPTAAEAERECQAAISAIGSNAVPFLLEWIQYEQPSWKREFGEFLSNAGLGVRLFEEKDTLAWGAVSGFRLIGSQGASAIPELNRLMHLTSYSPPAERAAAALYALGDASDRAIAAAFSTTNEFARMRATGAIFGGGARVERFAPLLINALDDSDNWVALNAADSLRRCDVDIAPALKRLTNSIARPETERVVVALAQLGVLYQKATPALPAITNLLSHTNSRVRSSATNALNKVVHGDGLTSCFSTGP